MLTLSYRKSNEEKKVNLMNPHEMCRLLTLHNLDMHLKLNEVFIEKCPHMEHSPVSVIPSLRHPGRET